EFLYEKETWERTFETTGFRTILSYTIDVDYKSKGLIFGGVNHGITATHSVIQADTMNWSYWVMLKNGETALGGFVNAGVSMTLGASYWQDLIIETATLQPGKATIHLVDWITNLQNCKLIAGPRYLRIILGSVF
ncbi:MAG: hypothetical protein ACTSPB_26790, partial [Candidatus Thorarchaeota archaeon]